VRPKALCQFILRWIWHGAFCRFYSFIQHRLQRVWKSWHRQDSWCSSGVRRHVVQARTGLPWPLLHRRGELRIGAVGEGHISAPMNHTTITIPMIHQ
jgi:hypothetical protein